MTDLGSRWSSCCENLSLLLADELADQAGLPPAAIKKNRVFGCNEIAPVQVLLQAGLPPAYLAVEKKTLAG